MLSYHSHFPPSPDSWKYPQCWMWTVRCCSWQSDSVEHAILSIPAALANVAAINGQAVSLGVSTVELSHPVHAHGVVVSRLHFLLLVHLETLGGGELLVQELSASQTDGVLGRLGDVEGRQPSGGWLRLDDVLGEGLVLVGVNSSWVVHRLRVGYVWLGDLLRDVSEDRIRLDLAIVDRLAQ